MDDKNGYQKPWDDQLSLKALLVYYVGFLFLNQNEPSIRKDEHFSFALILYNSSCRLSFYKLSVSLTII